MPAMILALETEVPSCILPQDDFQRATVRKLSLSTSHARFLQRVTSGSQIGKRHVVIDDFLDEVSEDSFFGSLESGKIPKTAQRNEVYKDKAPKLAEVVARKVLEKWAGDPKNITHVIAVSCTGMMAPGIEYLLIEKLGLSSTVERLGINFMGCFGAFKGLAIAKSIALENPDHRILVVCTELCSLHFQSDLQMDTMVANSLFADGAAAVVVGADPQAGENPLFEMEAQTSEALPGTLDCMTWEAGDYGYQMRLSAAVPAFLENHIESFVKRLIDGHTLHECAWAVHPGGRAILEAIQRACHLDQKDLIASWQVLRNYGNMSSPTFLFVLKELLQMPATKEKVIGLGFGPGLSIEGMRLRRIIN